MSSLRTTIGGPSIRLHLAWVTHLSGIRRRDLCLTRFFLGMKGHALVQLGLGQQVSRLYFTGLPLLLGRKLPSMHF